MRCRIADLRCKEVINVNSGFRFGYVYDVAFDTVTGQILAIVVPGPSKFAGILGKTDDYVIPWGCIKRVGEDIILVDIDGECCREKRPKTRPL